MTTKHTPEPWEVVDHSHYPSIMVLRGPSFHVSAVMAATDLTFEDYLKRSAELKLMSAAPEMLAALEIADKFCGSLTSDECPDSVHIPIRAAIAKARGAQ